MNKENESYIAEAPEPAGCVADGQPYIEAIRNAEVVISAWIETAKELGREIPKAKGNL